jgi:hypothetical protein
VYGVIMEIRLKYQGRRKTIFNRNIIIPGTVEVYDNTHPDIKVGYDNKNGFIYLDGWMIGYVNYKTGVFKIDGWKPTSEQILKKKVERCLNLE